MQQQKMPQKQTSSILLMQPSPWCHDAKNMSSLMEEVVDTPEHFTVGFMAQTETWDCVFSREQIVYF